MAAGASGTQIRRFYTMILHRFADQWNELSTGTLEQAALMKMHGPDLWLFNDALDRCSGRTGIADLLADGPRAAAELASECGVLESPLYRMLRAFGRRVMATGPRISNATTGRSPCLPSSLRIAFLKSVLAWDCGRKGGKRSRGCRPRSIGADGPSGESRNKQLIEKGKLKLTLGSVEEN